MAKNVQEARVDVTLNGEAAKNEIKTMKEQLEKFTAELERLQKTPVGALKPGEVQKMGELRKETQKMEKQIKAAEDNAEAFARTLKNINSSSLKDLQAAARRLSYEVKELAPGTQEFIEKSKQLQQVNTRIVQLRTSFKGLVVEQGNSVGFFKRLAGNLSNYFGAIMIGYQAVKRLAQGFMEAYKTISNFEQANANLASILGATSEQMAKMEKAAVALGSSSRYTATQVTELQTELAKLGFTTDQIVAMQKAVLNFAGSVGTDLASAAALAGVALRAFDLRADQTEDALGTMAVACNKSALSFTYLQNSFSTIAPVAKTYGLSLKDTTALLGTLANAGFDASSAATATRNILLNLSDTNGKLAKALGGTVNSFEDIMKAMITLREQGVDLNDTLELTDKRSVAAFNTFLDGAESAMELRGNLEDVNGELQRMAEQRANTVEGAIDGMKSAWEGFVLSFRSSTGTFASVFKFITGGINGIRDLIDPEGSIVERNARNYAEVFRGMGNEFISVYETQERIQKRFDEMNKYIDAGGGTARYKRYAKEGLQKAYEEVMSELESRAKAANEKVLELNEKYSKEEQKILKQQAKLTENGLNQSNMAAYNKLQEQLEANRKAWNEAIDDATKFKERMDDIVGDTGGGGSGGNGNGNGSGNSSKTINAYQEALKELKRQQREEENSWKELYANNKISKERFDEEMLQINMKYLERQVKLAGEYGEDETQVVSAWLDAQIAANERAYAEMMKMKEDWEAANQRDFEKWQKEFQELQAQAKEIKDRLHPKDKINSDFENELANLDKLHEAKLLSEEDYLAELSNLHKKHNQDLLNDDLENIKDYISKASAAINNASEFITQVKEMETAKIEAEYQAQLTAAGDNAEQREQIEAEYEQKKLDLQKKYADVDMAINIAKTIASGAAAAIKAYQEGGPYAGVALAAMIAATTAAKVATIIQQRNAIKNTSVSSSSNKSTPTGNRTVIDEGYAEGGFTKDHTTITTVGEKGVEWVGPNWMLKRDPVLFSNLERYRKQGSHGRSGSISRGFAEGGFTGNVSGNVAGGVANNSDLEAIVESAIVRAMDSGAIRAYLVRNDLTKLDKQDQRFKKQTSRG